MTAKCSRGLFRSSGGYTATRRYGGTLCPTRLLLLLPVKLCFGDTGGSSVGLGLGPTLHVATRIPKGSSREDDNGFLLCVQAAVPASCWIERPAQRFHESSQVLISNTELQERPCQGLSGNYVSNVTPTDLANLEGDTFKRSVL